MEKLRFVEKKAPDSERIGALLELSSAEQTWANRGPVYWKLAEQYSEFVDLPDNCTIVPVANGGVALEVMARLKAAKADRPLRWVASAYSFQNLGRGYFYDATFLDCDARGLLDMDALQALDPDSYDGIIVTNPFGLYAESLNAYHDFARSTGKHMLVDNASGLFSEISDCAWQSFSLHHTKPFGMGEGGLALMPKEVTEEYYELVNYTPAINAPEHWFQNGKLSDISAAYLIDRLEQFPDWGPRNLDQRSRVIEIAERCGLTPLAPPETDIPMTSMPFLSSAPIPFEMIEKTEYMTYAKYYRPLADLPCVTDLFSRLVNIPCHADVAELSDTQIETDIRRCVGNRI